MTKKIAILLGILATLATAAFSYANVAYFPMERGIVMEQKIDALPTKIDKILALLEKQQ